MLLHNNMKQNSWENLSTGQYYGSNTILGSPRGWIQRAVGWRQPDLGLHPTSLEPSEITVAGIWPRSQSLPDTGSYPAIYRYFDIITDIRKISRARPEDFYSVIGVGIAVPGDLSFEYYRNLRHTGAEWLWFDLPSSVKRKQRLANQDPPRVLPHQELYEMFERGLKPREIAEQLDLLVNSVSYVYRKWEAGHPPTRKPRVCVDHNLVIQDLRMDIPVVELVKKYGVSRAMIHKIKQRAKKYGEI